MANELTVINNFNLPAVNGAMAQAMEEEMDGLTLQFDRVKIPSGGGLVFEVPGDNPDEPDTVKELVGVIVDHHPTNAYWVDKYSGQNNSPDCSSLDGKTGIGNPGGNCKTCPMNQWGSDPDGGKACKNMHRVYILRPGEMIPLLLTLPPSSLKNLSNYLAKRVVGKGLRSYGVVTKVTLKKAQSKGGITYSEAVFSLVGTLSQEQTEQARQFSESIKPLTRQMQVDFEDYVTPAGEEEVM